MHRLFGAVLVLAGIGILYLAASGDRSVQNDPEAATVPPMARTALSVAGDMASAFADRTLMIHDLQRELRRVGCYEGEIHGVWTRSTQDAMERFTKLANAKLPTHEPESFSPAWCVAMFGTRAAMGLLSRPRRRERHCQGRPRSKGIWRLPVPKPYYRRPTPHLAATIPGRQSRRGTGRLTAIGLRNFGRDRTESNSRTCWRFSHSRGRQT